MPHDEPISWKSPTLNKGAFMVSERGEFTLTISHVDRTTDPYLAGVLKGTVIVYSGLHSTLSDARKTCEEKAQ